MNNTYQTRVTLLTPYQITYDWKDGITFYDAQDTAEIDKWVSEEKYDIGCVTAAIEDFIGDNGGRGWDEMDIEVKSFVHDVLKIEFNFSYFDTKDMETRSKSGYITIME